MCCFGSLFSLQLLTNVAVGGHWPCRSVGKNAASSVLGTLVSKLPIMISLPHPLPETYTYVGRRLLVHHRYTVPG
ncbi:hypothetical protein GGR54DRAFT_605601 [Hypoxylon sp. NC1633]|nr:hypothetical protein GGR54DRAFT_605601 [Hypoxylon sp. NC1633]